MIKSALQYWIGYRICEYIICRANDRTETVFHLIPPAVITLLFHSSLHLQRHHSPARQVSTAFVSSFLFPLVAFVFRLPSFHTGVKT